jgi:hypothetical protein
MFECKEVKQLWVKNDALPGIKYELHQFGSIWSEVVTVYVPVITWEVVLLFCFPGVFGFILSISILVLLGE